MALMRSNISDMECRLAIIHLVIALFTRSANKELMRMSIHRAWTNI
jgi:hypothetical protein